MLIGIAVITAAAAVAWMILLATPALAAYFIWGHLAPPTGRVVA